MKKLILTIIAGLICYYSCMAQTASQVLEKGLTVKPGEKIFLRFDKRVLKYDVARSLQDQANPIDYTTLEDSVIFLVSKSGVNVYLNPLNPLNYSYDTETKVIVDPINEAAASTLGSIIDVLSPTMNITTSGNWTLEMKDSVACQTGLIEDIENIQNLLEKSQRDDINRLFMALKDISFSDETNTKLKIKENGELLEPIIMHFAKIDTLLNLIKEKIDKCDFGSDDKIKIKTTKFIFYSIYKDLKVTADEQQKRLKNLQAAFSLVEKAQEIASSGGGVDGLKWCVLLNEVPAKEDKISVYSLTIKESGYKLSEKNEVVSIETKDVLKRTLRVRKFQRFVPEASIGTAYTFFKYNTYATTSDSAGVETKNQYVATPTENLVRNLNITTMLNFNYFIPNSAIHPLYQLGLGVNSGVPTLITGFGIRSNINGVKRLAISGGIAMTWLKELDKLKVGDRVSGSDAIDKDLKFQFAWPPKPYIGLQFNF